MKLETILNAYGYAMYDIGNNKPTLFRLGYILKRKEQAYKFKERLLEKIVEIDTDNGLNGSICEEGFYKCSECRAVLQLVRPGKWQCPRCG